MLFHRSALASFSLLLMSLSGSAYSAGHAHHEAGHQEEGHKEEGHSEQHSHVHGVAELMLAQEGNQLEILLESPAANIVGFEHKATSAEQIATVEQAEKLLNTPLKLFSFNGECNIHEIELDMASVEPEEHGHEHHDHDGEHHHAEHKHEHHSDHEKHEEEHASSHGEISVHYHFDCQSGDDVSAVTLNLKQHFPAIESLSVSWITEQGQGAVTLDEHQLEGSQRTVTFR